MLDQKTFLQGINYLKANYLNWQFDINNDLMLKVWFKKFSNLEPSIFMGMIEKYTELHRFPPNSPAELLDLLRDQIAQTELSSGEAWGEVIKLIHRHGFTYGREAIYKELEDKPALYRTVKEFEAELRNLQVDDSYTPERFKKAYNVYLKRQTETHSSKLLGTSSILLLE